MGTAQPSEIRIPEDKYIEVLQSKLNKQRTVCDQQEAVIMALLSDIEQLTAERDGLAESLNRVWDEREHQMIEEAKEQERASADSG